MENFPGNSRAQQRVERSDEPEQGEPVVKLEPVVTGKVIKRKKPLGRRLMDTFFNGDGVITYLGREVLLPAVQDIIVDVVKQGIEKAVLGEVRSASRARGARTGTQTHISYDRGPSSIIRSSVTPSNAPRRESTSAPALDIGQIILPSKIECETVTDAMMDTMQRYGVVTVANLNDLIGQTSVYTDNRWGWRDLTDMGIERVREGYLLVLPRPVDVR